jgi:hypothetical protein
MGIGATEAPPLRLKRGIEAIADSHLREALSLPEVAVRGSRFIDRKDDEMVKSIKNRILRP